MKDLQTISKFIELRAQGIAFAQIAAQLNVGKRTLIRWSRQYQFEIQNLRAIETEAIAAECLASRQQRIQTVAGSLRRVEDELAGRDLATVPTHPLFHIARALRADAARETEAIRFAESSHTLPAEEANRATHILQWQA